MDYATVLGSFATHIGHRLERDFANPPHDITLLAKKVLATQCPHIDPQDLGLLFAQFTNDYPSLQLRCEGGLESASPRVRGWECPPALLATLLDPENWDVKYRRDLEHLLPTEKGILHFFVYGQQGTQLERTLEHLGWRRTRREMKGKGEQHDSAAIIAQVGQFLDAIRWKEGVLPETLIEPGLDEGFGEEKEHTPPQTYTEPPVRRIVSTLPPIVGDSSSVWTAEMEKEFRSKNQSVREYREAARLPTQLPSGRVLRQMLVLMVVPPEKRTAEMLQLGKRQTLEHLQNLPRRVSMDQDAIDALLHYHLPAETIGELLKSIPKGNGFQEEITDAQLISSYLLDPERTYCCTELSNL